MLYLIILLCSAGYAYTNVDIGVMWAQILW